MEMIIILCAVSILCFYSLGLWAGSRPVRSLREAKNRADKKVVDALLERNGAQEFGDAMAAEARGQQKRADVLEEKLLGAETSLAAAKKAVAEVGARAAKPAKGARKAAAKRKKAV